MSAPVIEMHSGIAVVRDDLFPGSTKARFIPRFFEQADEVVYASPPEGGAQTALAYCARDLGKRVTIIVAQRQKPHARSLLAKALGAKVLQVSPGYMSVVQARARAYAEARRALLLPFGLDVEFASPAIAEAARATGYQPEEIWCAAGSGTLARGLKMAWPDAELNVVQIGKAIEPGEVGGRVHVHDLEFGQPCRVAPPFPSDWHYDAKAWQMCKRLCRKDRAVLFWNVAAPPASVPA